MVPARTLRNLALAVLLLQVMTACNRDADTDAEKAAQLRAQREFHAAQQAWRAQRLAALKTPDGWLSLIGLHWLHRGTHRVGSGEDNGIRLLMGPEHLGVFRVRDDVVRFSADTKLTVDGVERRSGVLRNDADPAGASVLGFDDGKGLLTVIRRNGRLALRVKHADAPSRVHFNGIDYWPGGPDWQVTAKFVPHAQGTTLEIGNIIGGIDQVKNPGALEFQRDGKTYRLEALDEGAGTLFLIFADRTSGQGSYGAGRFLDVPMPDSQGKVLIDFNHAYNPPCAFTPFATCPLPPAENRLDLAITAGEKAYQKPKSVQDKTQPTQDLPAEKPAPTVLAM